MNENTAENTANKTLRIFLTEFDGGLFGYDVQILSATATVGDYLDAINAFQANTMADCFGCDGCCHERVPLTIADFYFSRYYQQDNGDKLAVWLADTADLQFFGEAVDLQIKHKPNGACYLLDEEQKCCSAHLHRTFACRTHCCLPRSERAENLRAVIINSAEDELVRCLLLELAADGKGDFIDGENRLQAANPDDYANAFGRRPPTDWAQTPLIELIKLTDDELWQELLEE